MSSNTHDTTGATSGDYLRGGSSVAEGVSVRLGGDQTSELVDRADELRDPAASGERSAERAERDGTWGSLAHAAFELGCLAQWLSSEAFGVPEDWRVDEVVEGESGELSVEVKLRNVHDIPEWLDEDSCDLFVRQRDGQLHADVYVMVVGPVDGTDLVTVGWVTWEQVEDAPWSPHTEWPSKELSRDAVRPVSELREVLQMGVLPEGGRQ